MANFLNRVLMEYKYELFCSLFIPILLTVKLTSLPPLMFTEGWVLSIARNWVKLGHYSQIMNGTPVSASMLNVGFPAIVPAALSFRLLGVGVWQGRLPFVLFTLGSIVLIYHLAKRLYDRSTARGVIAVLLLLSTVPEVNPLVVGRMALGEMPSLFYLLAGYLCFLRSLRNPSLIYLFLTCLFWGLSLITKLQPLPFLASSLTVAFFLLWLRRSRRLAGVVAASLFGSLISFYLMRLIQGALLHSKTLFEAQHGIFSVTAFVPVFSFRLLSLAAAIFFAGPTLLGIIYTARRYLRDLRAGLVVDELETTRLCVLIFVATWMGWYLLLSSGAMRYLFPPAFLGSIFFTRMLWALTDQFNFRLSFQHAAESMGRKCSKRSIAVLLMLLYVSLAASITLRDMVLANTRAESCVIDTAQYINKDSRPGSLVESYDMELFFLLKRPYHYPENSTIIKLDQRDILGRKVSIDYDPLEANPDYLIVGPMTRTWRLYDSVLKTGSFRLVKKCGPYDIYRRSRK